MSDVYAAVKDCVCWICEKVTPIATIERHLHSHSEEEHTRAVRKMMREQVAIAAARPPDPEPLQRSGFSEEKYKEVDEGVDKTGEIE